MTRVKCGSAANAVLLLLFVAVIGLMTLISGCSAPKDGSAVTPYSGEIKAAAKQATSDFEKQVLSDGAITRAEYEEAIQRYVACGKQHGLDIGLIDQGGWYTYSMRTPEANDKIEVQCNQGTIMLIGGLYEQIAKNPNHESIDDVEYRCLVRLKVAPGGYTLEQYRQDKKSEQMGGYVTPTGVQVTSVPGVGKPINAGNPYPFDNTSLTYSACMDNPSAPQTN